MMTKQLTNPLLARLVEETEVVRLDARGLLAGLSAEQANWKPAPARWSVAQCLEHVTRSVNLYPAKVDAMLGEARTRMQRGQRAYRNGWIAGIIIATMDPPPRLRAPTASAASPPSSLDVHAVADAFDAAHAWLIDAMTRADGLSLRHARTGSPFAPRIRFTLEQVFRVNVPHARRHLWQAREVTRASGFPG